jgi:hypothetical protein
MRLAAADVFLDRDRFSGAVVDELDVEQLDQDRAACAHLERELAGAADHLLGGDTVGGLGEGSHEFDAASRPSAYSRCTPEEKGTGHGEGGNTWGWSAAPRARAAEDSADGGWAQRSALGDPVR